MPTFVEPTVFQRETIKGFGLSKDNVVQFVSEVSRTFPEHHTLTMTIKPERSEGSFAVIATIESLEDTETQESSAERQSTSRDPSQVSSSPPNPSVESARPLGYPVERFDVI